MHLPVMFLSSDPRFEKLPKWVRQGAQHLEGRIKYLMERIAQLEVEATDDTPVVYGDYISDVKALPDGFVEFRLLDANGVRHPLRLRIIREDDEGSQLQVMHVSTRGKLTVRPNVSNVITLTVE